MKKYMLPASVTAVFGVFCLTSVAPAALIIQEDFNYTSGSNLSAVSSWTDVGDDSTVQASSLSYGSLATSGGSALMGGTDLNNRLNVTNLDFAGRETWLSVLIEPDGTSNENSGLYLRGTPTTTAGDYLWLFGFPGDSDEYNARRFLPNPPGGSTTTGNSTAIGSGGNTAMLVAHFDFTQSATEGLITFYLNPDVSSLGVGSSPTSAQFSQTLGNVSSAADEQPNFTLTELEIDDLDSSDMVIDEIRIGDTWADVSPVPEPSSVGLLMGFGALLVGLRRHRRNSA